VFFFGHRLSKLQTEFFAAKKIQAQPTDDDAIAVAAAKCLKS